MAVGAAAAEGEIMADYKPLNALGVQPSWGRPKTLGGLLDLPSEQNMRTVAELLSMEPGLLGSVAAAGLTADDLRKGEYGTAALNALGLLPAVPAMGGMVVSAKRGKGLPQFEDPLTGHKKAYLSDVDAKLKTENIPRNQFNENLLSLSMFEKKKLGEILDHPELYSRYPELSNTPVSGLFSMSASGAFSPKTKSLYMGGANETDFMETLLHEIQHKIQGVHGWTPGGNPSMFMADPELYQAAKSSLKSKLSEYETAIKARFPSFNKFKKESDLPKDLVDSPEYRQFAAYREAEEAAKKADDEFYQKYRRLGGEAEARATSAMWKNETRKVLQGPPEKYDRFNSLINRKPISQSVNPLDYYDVPLDELRRGVLD